jgi:hypothetical protein
MFALRFEKWLRVACGVCLLWLLVVQEKLWPWLLTSPVRAVATRSPGKAPPKNKLPYLLPDTLQSRWWAGDSQHGLRTLGSRDGVVSCGQQRPSRGTHDWPSTPAADAQGWRCLQSWIETIGSSPAEKSAPGALALAVRTCISLTGPPPA